MFVERTRSIAPNSLCPSCIQEKDLIRTRADQTAFILKDYFKSSAQLCGIAFFCLVFHSYGVINGQVAGYKPNAQQVSKRLQESFK
jgi:hypothetical protein